MVMLPLFSGMLVAPRRRMTDLGRSDSMTEVAKFSGTSTPPAPAVTVDRAMATSEP